MAKKRDWVYLIPASWGFSESQVKMFALLAGVGWDPEFIAGALGLDVVTVRCYCNILQKKTGVKGPLQLVALARVIEGSQRRK
jgi:DNA-binding NarL/FixJ family response regulator